MKKEIVPIRIASEEVIEFLIKVGILYTDKNGLHVIEN